MQFDVLGGRNVPVIANVQGAWGHPAPGWGWTTSMENHGAPL